MPDSLRVLVLLPFLLALAPPAWAETPAEKAAALVATRRAEVMGHLEADRAREALRATSEFEQAVRELYPPMAIADGVLAAPAVHLRMPMPLPDLPATGLGSLPLTSMARTGGWDVLASCGDGETSWLLMTVLMSSFEIRLGEMGRGTLSGDDGLRLMAGTFAAGLGVAPGGGFISFGGRRAFVQDVAGLPIGPALRLALFREDGRFFLLLFSTPAAKFDAVARELSNAVAGADFAFSPEDSAAVDRERAKVDMTDPVSILAGVQALVGVGEFGAAADLLSGLRVLLYGKLPRLTVSEESARFPAYGVELRNPDRARFRLADMALGPIPAVLLTSRTPPDDFGVIAGVMDLAYLLGPKIGELLADEGARDYMLASSARGAVLNVGGKIETERGLELVGRPAWEVVADIPKANLRMRVRVILEGDFALMLTVAAPPAKAPGVFAEFDRMLFAEENLRLPPTAAEAK